MQQFAYNIGAAIIHFFMSIDSAALTKSLSIMGVGMLGIFVVTGVIILVVTLLNKLLSD